MNRTRKPKNIEQAYADITKLISACLSRHNKASRSRLIAYIYLGYTLKTTYTTLNVVLTPPASLKHRPAITCKFNDQ